MADGNPYERSEGFLPPIDEPGISGYEILGVLGEGGFGRVYRARQDAFDREVAIKVLAATGLRDEIAGRFERECRAVGGLSGHPHIVTIYDSGITPGGRPYIVMDHMSRGSLGDLIKSEGPLDAYVALDIIVKIAGAVETTHRAGILHRDIKPENILLSAFSEPKLADFGVASIPGGYRTHTGAITASLSHAAPEVLKGHKATRGVDIYALGSTLFASILGRAAFESDEEAGLQGLIARTLTHPVPDLRPLGVPDDICRVIEMAMSKDPADRFASADELGAALQAAQERSGRPVTQMAVPDPEGPVITYAVDLDGDPGRTAIRERRELTPPLPSPPKRRWVWRSPVTAGLVALLLLGSSTGVIALRSRSRPKQPATAPAGQVERPAEVATGASSPEHDEKALPSEKRSRTDKKGSNKHRKAGRSSSFGGPYAFSGGGDSTTGGGGLAPPASQPTPSGNEPGPSTNGGAGGEQQKPPPPPPPNEEPATLALHYYSKADGSYYFTADQANADEQWAAYDNHVIIAAVWRSPGEGLIPLCLTPERCEGFVSSRPPKKGAYKTLYTYEGTHGRFFTTDRASVPSGRHAYLVGYTR